MKALLLTVALFESILTGQGGVAEEPVTFDQDDFPCMEDEVLGFHPDFGPGKVGCIHIDELKGEAR